MFLAGISLQSFGRHCKKAARKRKSNECKRFKTKAGFGEGTPQQVRPVSETRFQILKLWPQVDTCLSLFPSKMKIQISNWISVSKAGSAQVPIEVSLACGRRLHRICVPAPVLQRRCPARPHFVRGHGTVSRSRRLMQFSRCGADMKNCRPVARLQILSEYKENRPARDQRILSEANGGKMVRCGCRAAV